MKPARTAGRWMSVLMALVFGFMALGHGPIMTFAHAATHEAPAQHHHHEPDAMPADEAVVCNAFGCFITVGAIAVEAPPAELLPIGKLVPRQPPPALPADSEPADPPPRLRA